MMNFQHMYPMRFNDLASKVDVASSSTSLTVGKGEQTEGCRELRFGVIWI